MDINAYRVLVDGADKSDSIESLRLDGSWYRITYKNSNKEYAYSSRRVKLLPREESARPSGPAAAADKTQANAPRPDQKSARTGPTAALLDYFQKTAEAVSLVSDDGENLLSGKYQTLAAPHRDSVLYSYLRREATPRRYAPPEKLIYPFGINLSQKAALERAFSSQVSIIQGPPGTGKTQTILNIIANAVLRGETVAVVSNNNLAVQNVGEKLAKKGLSFLTASLGSQVNTQRFLDNQPERPPDITGWRLKDARAGEEASALIGQLEKLLDVENRLAQRKQELREWKWERQYFLSYCKTRFRLPDDIRLSGLSSRLALQTLFQCEQCLIFNDLFQWSDLLKKLSGRLAPETIARWAQYPKEALLHMKLWFYDAKIHEMAAEIKALAENLNQASIFARRERLALRSFQLLLNELARRYDGGKEWRRFTGWALRASPETFTKQYPVVLCTAYTIRGALGQENLGSEEEYLYDYLIIDEASQVDLATGALAFSCAKNVVIVGDLQQLPNVCSKTREAEAVWKQYDLPEMYHYTAHSLLSSAIQRWTDVPVTLLREHYRCHPRIINFCNQKFYGGRLLAMTADRGETDVLTLRLTKPDQAAGKHISQGQIDVIQNQLLPELEAKGYDSLGIITPYRDQVQALKARIGEEYEVATVHQFQGREKDAIILSSVDDNLGPFVDNPNMLNVAVSRAVKSLAVVTSSSPGNNKTNYGDLVRYIRYYTGACVNQPLCPVCVLLSLAIAEMYRTYEIDDDPWNMFWDEMFDVIEELLREPDFSWIGCVDGVHLDMVIQDRSLLDEEELEYADNQNDVRFLLYHQMDKAPLGIVDLLPLNEDEEEDGRALRIRRSLCRKYGIPYMVVCANLEADGGKTYWRAFAQKKKREVRAFLRAL